MLAEIAKGEDSSNCGKAVSGACARVIMGFLYVYLSLDWIITMHSPMLGPENVCLIFLPKRLIKWLKDHLTNCEVPSAVVNFMCYISWHWVYLWSLYPDQHVQPLAWAVSPAGPSGTMRSVQRDTGLWSRSVPVCAGTPLIAPAALLTPKPSSQSQPHLLLAWHPAFVGFLYQKNIIKIQGRYRGVPGHKGTSIGKDRCGLLGKGFCLAVATPFPQQLHSGMVVKAVFPIPGDI